MSSIRDSWNAVSKSAASTYLSKRNSREAWSRELLVDFLIKESTHLAHPIRVLDVGCGNGNLSSLLDSAEIDYEYVGVDFSLPLLKEARNLHPRHLFILDDCEQLTELETVIEHKFDFAVYSHVIEMMESPQSSLEAVKKYASNILIEFFEPPSDAIDVVELLFMDLGEGEVPYLRRKISNSVYQAWLFDVGVNYVDRFVTQGKYELHVLRFDSGSR